MSLQTVGKEFVELCNQGKNFDVMAKMYGPDIVSVEADGSETSGKDQVIDKSRRWATDNQFLSEKADGPFFNGDSQFAVHYTMEVIRNDTGQHIQLEEVGVYTVGDDDHITREQFYYQGKH